MDNRILRVEVRDHVLTPAVAEVHVVVRTAFRTPSTELRGRLMGPQCHFASTVEVAYPLRSLQGHDRPESDELLARVVIPEASLWDPQSPFLYDGPIELWEEGRRCDVSRVRHGLRLLKLGPRGVTLNGRPLTLREKEMTAACSDDQALQLRQSGYNLLVAPVTEATLPLWEIGDRLGFLVIGRLEAADAKILGLVAELRRHPSCAGWLASNPDLRVEGALPPGALGPIDPAD